MESMKIELPGKNLDLSAGPLVMGILNVTPDSFSDGGKFVTGETIKAHAATMVAAGADLLDIGGESSRPFADLVSLEDELARVIPAITAIRQDHQIPISIDTYKAEVARQALAAGADIVNDISALRFDPEMVRVLEETGVPVIIMHMQGSPRDMQISPTYSDVVAETKSFFEERLTWLSEHGIGRDRVIVDPGIGFGKNIDHNLSILKHAASYRDLGCPVLIGHSRKSFIGRILGNNMDNRDLATASITALMASQGIDIIRVHDVPANMQALKMAQAITTAL